MKAGDFWAALPLGRGVTVLTHDESGLAALSKPAGILSHPNTAADEARSLLKASYTVDGECYAWKGANPKPAPGPGDPGPDPCRLWLLNRLDSATSGVILVSADGALAAAVRAQFRLKQVHKIYRALVFGRPRETAEVWRDRLATDKRGGRIRTSGGSVPAESRMSVVRTGNAVTLIGLEPRTGRSHQLRVQCAERGLPIVGDQTYGDFRRNRAFAKLAGTKRMFLHSLETRFSYDWGGRERAFLARAPLPPEFEAHL